MQTLLSLTSQCLHTFYLEHYLIIIIPREQDKRPHTKMISDNIRLLIIVTILQKLPVCFSVKLL